MKQTFTILLRLDADGVVTVEDVASIVTGGMRHLEHRGISLLEPADLGVHKDLEN